MTGERKGGGGLSGSKRLLAPLEAASPTGLVMRGYHRSSVFSVGRLSSAERPKGCLGEETQPICFVATRILFSKVGRQVVNFYSRQTPPPTEYCGS